jgi:hypothetical protein
MRSVRFVSSGADRDVVIVEVVTDADVPSDSAGPDTDAEPTEASRAERFELQVDDALRTAVGPAIDSDADPARPESGREDSTGDDARAPSGRPALELSPRDIQVRVRAGEDPAELAEETGMSLARIMRFADAVVAERARVTDEARRSRARRDGDGALVPFGETVDRRFTHHGIEPTTVAWDSSRRSDGSWLVTARWRGDGPERQAHWVFSLAQRTLLPGDEAAADLLSERALRPVVQAVPTPSEDDTAAIPPVAAGTEVYETVFDQEAEDPPPGARPVSPPRAANPSGRGRETPAAPPSARPPAQPAPTAPAPRRAEPVLRLADPLPIFGEVETDDDIIPFEQDPLDAPAGASAQSDAADHAADHVAGLGPDLDPGHPGEDEAAPPPRRGSGRSKAAREQTRIPSWDDILLGVRRKQD